MDTVLKKTAEKIDGKVLPSHQIGELILQEIISEDFIGFLFDAIGLSSLITNIVAYKDFFYTIFDDEDFRRSFIETNMKPVFKRGEVIEMLKRGEVSSMHLNNSTFINDAMSMASKIVKTAKKITSEKETNNEKALEE